VLTACIARDLPILEITARKLAEMVPLKSLHVVVRGDEMERFRSRLGSTVRLIPEDGFIPGMTLHKLQQLPLESFPKGAGWYFQQFLKLQFAFEDTADDYYLIWDADTIPLRPLRFFDCAGRMLLTKAAEYHAPYFETYRKVLGEEPRREFSFIAQHILVQKSVARAMLRQIERQLPGADNWAWKIMRVLPDHGLNLFSEYETYGHYVKQHHPDRAVFIERNWSRRGAKLAARGVPRELDLKRLAKDYDYAAFELASVGLRGLKRRAFSWLKGTPRLED
jgi:hypothetical protein